MTNAAEWPAYFSYSADEGLFGFNPGEASLSLGLGSRLLTASQPWFLKSLFLLRVAILPLLGRLPFVGALALVCGCWLAGFIYLPRGAGDAFGPPGVNSLVLAFYHAPMFLLGFWCQRGGVAASYIALCRQ